MATLQRIRNRAGVLVAGIIGLSLLAFILGDLLSSGQSIFSGKRLEMAKISGKKINILDYNKKIEELENFYKMTYNIGNLDMETVESIREETWRNTIREIILGRAFDDLGINVSNDELKTMLIGDSLNTILADEPHPIIRNMFTNPETGEFNRAQMVSYFEAISNPVYKEEKKRWILLENQIVNERMSIKYFNLVRQGIQPSSLDAKFYAKENETAINFSYVFSSFSSIPDEGITLSAEEIQKYYDEHKETYRQEDKRSIEYVVFELLPSTKDDANAHDFISQSKQTFERTDNPVSFVNNYSDRPYTDKNYGRTDLPEMIRDSIFDAKPGFVAGPYLHDRIYKLARVMEFVNISDSVRARHILISLSVQRDDARAKTIADSLLQLINRGADFNTLALQYSADESNKAIGGDLGWFREGQMVKPFNDACFNAKPGDVKVVKTNYGYHVIRLEAQSPMVRKVKVAFLEREITPSDETTQEIYSKAVSFAAASGNIDEFRNTCRKENITPRFASDINPADKTLPGLENAREIIRWAFENDEGAVSSIFDMSDKYIIAALSGLKQKGYASVESVKAEIEIALKKQKKLEKLAADIKTRTSSAGSIDEIATILGSEVSEATEVRFTNPYISNVGIEPAVVVHAFNLPAGSLSEPVIGENGVFVLTVNNIISPENPNVFSARLRLKYALDGRATYEGYEALKTSANITDNRIKFF